MTDVVEGEIPGRVAEPETAPAGVKGRSNAELAATLPDGIVVVMAVEAELIVADGEAAERGIEVPRGREPALNAAREHADFRAELLGGEIHLRDRLIRRVHGDDRRGGETVPELLEILGGDDVEAADDGAAGLVVGDAVDAESRRRIDDREVDADLLEAVVEHPRHHRGGAVASIGRLARPIGLHGDATLLALRDRELERVGNALLALDEPVRRLVAGNLAHPLREDREIFEPVAVGVDDRMLEAGTDFSGIAMRAHDPPSEIAMRALAKLRYPSGRAPAMRRRRSYQPKARRMRAQSAIAAS